MKDSYLYYKDKLSREYLNVFNQIEMYVLSQNIDDNKREERLGELLDIFLNAQEMGKPVQKITGNNLESFCRTFCSDFSAKDRFLNVADWFKSIAWWLVIISSLDIVFSLTDTADIHTTASGGLLWETASSLNISGYLVGILISGALCLFTNILLRHIMFKTKQMSLQVLKAVSVAVAVLCFIIIFLLLDENTAHFFTCPAWIVLSLSGLYVLLYHILRGRKIKKQKIKFFDLVNKESEKEFPAEMEKKFEKARKKHLKKGKGELTLEAFLEKEEKDCDRTEKFKPLYDLFPFAITACMFAATWLSDGFDSAIDAVIFVLIMLVIECPLMHGLWKISKTGIVQRRKWIAAKREECQDKTGHSHNIQSVHDPLQRAD